MLVDLAVPVDPGVKFALTDSYPGNKPSNRDVGLVAPGPDKINNGISRIMGNPDAV